MSKASQPFGQDVELHDTSFGWRFTNPKLDALYGSEAMGITAENLVEMYNISRKDQDKFAYNSQLKASLARDNGRLSKETIEVLIPQKKQNPLSFQKDEFIRSTTTIAGLSILRTAFKKNGTVTAGNSSGLNDGAAATIVASKAAVEKYNLNPMAKIIASAVVGVEPRIMGIGPVKASAKALSKAGLDLSDMDVIELNEAFAAQSLSVIREWGLADNDARINPNGGAIALGHPLGMSGTRITYSCALELNLRNKKYGLATMCIGVGQGYATILENCRI
jgi:acetyl-CoA acetyltransferase family protein